MALDANGVEIVEGGAPTPPAAAPAPKTEAPVVDPVEIANQAIAIAEAATAKLAQAESDRDNYKQGMLVKDKKLKDLKDQGFEIPDEEAKGLSLEDVSRLLDEKLAQRSPAPEVNGLQKQVSELKTALINRQGLPATPTGNGAEIQEPKAARWVDSPEVAARLKEQGLDPDTVYANWKANQTN